MEGKETCRRGWGGHGYRREDQQELILFYNVIIKSHIVNADLKKSFQNDMQLTIQNKPNLNRLQQWTGA